MIPIEGGAIRLESLTYESVWNHPQFLTMMPRNP